MKAKTIEIQEVLPVLRLYGLTDRIMSYKIPLKMFNGYYMTRSTIGIKGLPTDLRQRLKVLGNNIRLARKRRRLTMQDLADRMFVTRKTLKRLEDGDPGTSLGVVASALLVLGLEDDLTRVADPQSDAVGNALDRDHHEQTQRTRKPTGKRLDLNF